MYNSLINYNKVINIKIKVVHFYDVIKKKKKIEWSWESSIIKNNIKDQR